MYSEYYNPIYVISKKINFSLLKMQQQWKSGQNENAFQ